DVSAEELERLLDDGAVRREDPRRRERQHALERRQVFRELAPQAGGDPDGGTENGEIAAEERAALLVPEAEMVGGVAGCMDGRQRRVAGLDAIAVRKRRPAHRPLRVTLL